MQLRMFQYMRIVLQGRRVLIPGLVIGALVLLSRLLGWPFEILGELEGYKKPVVELNKQAEPSNAKPMPHLRQDMTTEIPNDTWVRSFRYKKCEIYISGYSNTPSTALIRQLEKSPFLKDIETVGRTYKDPLTGKEVFTFKAKLKSNDCE